MYVGVIKIIGTNLQQNWILEFYTFPNDIWYSGFRLAVGLFRDTLSKYLTKCLRNTNGHILELLSFHLSSQYVHKKTTHMVNMVNSN